MASQRDRTAETARRSSPGRVLIAEDDPDKEDALFSRAEASKSKEELAQYRRDRHRREERLASLTDERHRELEAVDARYHEPKSHSFPVAVIFVVPKREATR